MASMIVCPEPLAAVAGQEMFAAGGNAIDAAIAAAFAQGVTNPLLCGIGGNGLLYYYEAAKHKGVVLNCEASIGSRPVPASWATECMGRAETVGRFILPSEANQVGHQSVMTPGFVRGCWDAYERYGSGRLKWAELLMPAIRLARDGFAIYPYIADFWRETAARPGYPSLATKLAATPDANRTYLKRDGRVYQADDWLVQSDMGRTLDRLAYAGADDFYSGEIAQVIADDFARHEGFITPDDLQGYATQDEPVVRGHYRGLEVTSAGAPSTGPQLIQMLQILEHFDPVALGHNTAEYIDLVARIQRASFADGIRLNGIEASEARHIEQATISRERAAYWAERIRDGDRIEVRGGVVDPGTTHLTCVDADHNVVCFNHSIGSAAGSGVITPGLGFLYNNFLGHYNPVAGQYNSIVPGKRMGGSQATIVFKAGEPYMAIGAPGGSRIVTACMQALVNVIDHGMDIDSAVSAPRFHSEEQQLVFLEPIFAESLADSLRAIGNTVERSPYQARVQAIRILSGSELEAGADPRGGRGVGFHASALLGQKDRPTHRPEN